MPLKNAQKVEIKDWQFNSVKHNRLVCFILTKRNPIRHSFGWHRYSLLNCFRNSNPIRRCFRLSSNRIRNEVTEPVQLPAIYTQNWSKKNDNFGVHQCVRFLECDCLRV